MEKSSTDCYQIPSSSARSAEKSACTDSAPHKMTRSTKSSSSVTQILAVALICVVCVSIITRPVESALMIRRRAISAEVAPDTKTEIKLCQNSTPCGWAVYTPFTRRTDYYMKNACECPKDKKCQQTDDNLSASAYVYRCRIPPLTNSTDQDVDV